MIENIRIGTIIIDLDKYGIVTSIVQSGSWSNDSLRLSKTFEIKYLDGVLSMMSEKTLKRLLDGGQIVVVSY